MHIVCPHCTTSYAINLATLGVAGRTVRCSRCKEVWLALPGDAVEIGTPVPAMADAGGPPESDAAAEWEALAREDGQQTPMVDSPSISADWPDADDAGTDWPSIAQDEVQDRAVIARRPLSWLRKLLKPRAMPRLPGKALAGLAVINLPVGCAAMGALVLALVIWRADLVRLLPQTATFYGMLGLDVNLRGLAFKDVKITRETVDGKAVLVIEGMIVGETRRPVELPRLRFSVRDAQGAEIYAWNAVLEQSVLKPGEKAWFKSRLASPPPEGRNIDVRFFTRRDIAGGSA